MVEIVIQTFLLAAWIGVVIYAFKMNNDSFSPAKILLGYTAIFMAAVFIYNMPVYIQAVFIFYTLLGGLLAWREQKMNSSFDSPCFVPSPNKLNTKQIRLISAFFWILSIAPLVSFFLFVHIHGGFCAFINSIATRVQSWAGTGMFFIAIRTLSVINLLYFISGFYFRIKNKAWWYIFIIHTIVLVIINMFLGTRAILLFPLIYLIIIFNYGSRRLSLLTIVPSVILAFSLAIGLGAIRNSIRCDPETGSINVPYLAIVQKYSEEGVSEGGVKEFIPELKIYTEDSEKNVEKQTGFLEALKSHAPSEISYAVLGLAIVPKLQFEPALGATFLTGFTNLIPRKLWPGKPDTAGVWMTKMRDGDKYHGYSTMLPGIIGESMLNFGFVVGFVFGLIAFALIMILSHKLYFKLIINNKTKPHYILYYIYIVFAATSMIYFDSGTRVSYLIMNLLTIYVASYLFNLYNKIVVKSDADF